MYVMSARQVFVGTEFLQLPSLLYSFTYSQNPEDFHTWQVLHMYLWWIHEWMDELWQVTALSSSPTTAYTTFSFSFVQMDNTQYSSNYLCLEQSMGLSIIQFNYNKYTNTYMILFFKFVITLPNLSDAISNLWMCVVLNT